MKLLILILPMLFLFEACATGPQAREREKALVWVKAQNKTQAELEADDKDCKMKSLYVNPNRQPEFIYACMEIQGHSWGWVER